MATNQKTPGSSGSRDEEGLITHVQPYFAKTISQVETIGEPFMLGVPEVSRTWSELENQDVGYQVDVTYQGRSKEEEGKPTYSLDLSLAEEPIETFPQIEDLKNRFGGIVNEDGRIQFPEKLPRTGTGGSGGLTGGTTTVGDKNPLFGLTTYLVTKAIVEKTMIQEKVPRDLFDEIGTITDRIPGNFIPTPKGRNWMVLPAGLQQQGDAVTVTYRWMMSAPGGWPEAIYRLIQR
jgi:hypothetical protein